MTTGYSGKTLPHKLGIKTGQNVSVVNAPDRFYDYLGDLPDPLDIDSKLKKLNDMIIFFSENKKNLKQTFPELKGAIKSDGMIWIAWQKKSSGIKSDLDENVIRDAGIDNKMVDIKVISIDEKWSGLKFVIPKNLR